MASEIQSKYIADLTVLKTKEFKEVKELLLASDIVGNKHETITAAQNIKEVTHALTDLQASKFIDLLVQTKEPKRGNAYSTKRIDQTIGLLDDIKDTVSDWGF